MNNIRETSQQDRRVYVGNLSYDVKWHHLKDFMRQGGFQELSSSATQYRS
jgi:RNA recognition motif-containing protein